MLLSGRVDGAESLLGFVLLDGLLVFQRLADVELLLRLVAVDTLRSFLPLLKYIVCVFVIFRVLLSIVF